MWEGSCRTDTFKPGRLGVAQGLFGSGRGAHKMQIVICEVKNLIIKHKGKSLLGEWSSSWFILLISNTWWWCIVNDHWHCLLLVVVPRNCPDQTGSCQPWSPRCRTGDEPYTPTQCWAGLSSWSRSGAVSTRWPATTTSSCWIGSCSWWERYCCQCASPWLSHII